MLEALKELRAEVDAFHAKMYDKILSLRENQPELKDIPELADIGFQFKWFAQVFKDIGTESDKLSSLAQKIACMKWLGLPETSRPDVIVDPDGNYRAFTDLTMSANIPSRSKDPEAYDAFMEWIGVPEPLIGTELVRVHWPTFKKTFTKLVSEGKPLPPGIDPEKTHAHYQLRYRDTKA